MHQLLDRMLQVLVDAEATGVIGAEPQQRWGGGIGISKFEVSRICAGRGEQVAAYDTRQLEHCAFPYVFLDAIKCKARVNGRVVSQAG